MDIGETALDSVVIKTQALVIEPQQVEHGRVQVVDRADIFDRFVAKFVGSPIAESASDPRSCQPHGEAMRIVIAPAGAFLECGHPAKFGDPRHERFVQQTTSLQVFN